MRLVVGASLGFWAQDFVSVSAGFNILGQRFSRLGFGVYDVWGQGFRVQDLISEFWIVLKPMCVCYESLLFPCLIRIP